LTDWLIGDGEPRPKR